MVRVILKQDIMEETLIRQNCSKKELAYRIGVSRSYLSSICTGRREPSTAMRRRLLEYFVGYTFDQLFKIVKAKNGSKGSD